jgi:hypothetical protein
LNPARDVDILYVGKLVKVKEGGSTSVARLCLKQCIKNTEIFTTTYTEKLTCDIKMPVQLIS